MKTINFLPRIQPSVLGFGCAPILGSVGKDRSLTALNTAWSNGINYFDVAPSYGYGEAEKLLGQFLAGKRDQAFIATKFGVVATPAARLLRPVKGIVRALKGSTGNSGGTAAVASVGSKMLKPLPITAALAKHSVEKSLRNLGTDYLDLLMMHEPLTEVESFESVLEGAEQLKREGKIRAFGLAGNYEDVFGMHAGLVSRLDFLQIGVPDGLPPELTASRGSLPNVFFGLAKSFKRQQAAGTVEEYLIRWSEAFPSSVIILSMFSPNHIIQNCKAFEE